MRLFAQRFTTTNDAYGNPRRVILYYNEQGEIVDRLITSSNPPIIQDVFVRLPVVFIPVNEYKRLCTLRLKGIKNE